MKPLSTIVGLMILLPAILMAKEKVSVEDAISILENSLNKEERRTALITLKRAKEEAAPAATTLGRIIATSPSGDEATLASIALRHVGRANVPVVAELVPNGFEYAYICGTRIVRYIPTDLEEELIPALEPTLSLHTISSKHLFGIIALRWYSFSPDEANRLTRAQIDDSYSYYTKLGAALFLAGRANDPSILTDIEAYPTKCMKYIGARHREYWRRRNSPIHIRRHMLHVLKPLPKEEQERCNEADAILAELSAIAIPEALDGLKHADHPREQYLWMETLKTLSEHSSLPIDITLETLNTISRERGSLIDKLLIDYSNQLSVKIK